MIVIGIMISRWLYYRYFPVLNVKGIKEWNLEDDRFSIVDVREYNEIGSQLSFKQKIIHIPLSYAHRYYSEINTKEVVLIVSDNLLRNLGIRFFKKKGFSVIGYICVPKK